MASLFLKIAEKIVFNELVSELSTAALNQPLLGGLAKVIDVQPHSETIEVKIGNEVYDLLVTHKNPDATTAANSAAPTAGPTT